MLTFEKSLHFLPPGLFIIEGRTFLLKVTDLTPFTLAMQKRLQMGRGWEEQTHGRQQAIAGIHTRAVS